MQTKHGWLRCGWLVAGFLALFGAGPVQAQYTNLHEFSGGVGDGRSPFGSLTLSGTTLYGMTRQGGISDKGVIFKMSADGSGYTKLHMFAGGAGDGAGPTGDLTLSGTTLYGMTVNGGANDLGVIFKMNTDGSGYANLREFVGGAGDGREPYGSLTLSGTTLYGMTEGGGASVRGVIFKVNTDGSGYANLREFTGGAGDGAIPKGSLTLSGTSLYGMTQQGGISNNGVIFKVNADGSGYIHLHEFVGGAGDGKEPRGSLTLSGTSLYGMTQQGGTSDRGVIFKVNTNGSGYTNLHEFVGGAGDGAVPVLNDLTLSGTNLYGMTYSGGTGGYDGVVFRIHADGSGYTNLHEFAGGPSEGRLPYGTLTLSGTTLYGMTYQGGASNNGVLFAMSLAPPAATAQFFFQDGTGQVAGWLVGTNGIPQTTRLLGSAGAWQLKTAGDVDGDGTSDLLFQTAAGDFAIWFLNTDGTLKSTRFVGNTGAWQVRACADYDGNGKPEIFFQTAAGAIAYWQTTPNGTCTNAVPLGNAGPWQLKTAVDVDGDGKAEVFWQQADGTVAAWFHNPDSSIRGQLIGATGQWELRAATDVDGDGVGDLLWQTSDSRTAGWFMNPNGTARATSFWGATGGWKLKAAGK